MRGRNRSPVRLFSAVDPLCHTFRRYPFPDGPLETTLAGKAGDLWFAYPQAAGAGLVDRRWQVFPICLPNVLRMFASNASEWPLAVVHLSLREPAVGKDDRRRHPGARDPNSGNTAFDIVC